MSDQPKLRVTVKVVEKNSVHSRLSMWVNSGMVTPPAGICLRNEEVDAFVARVAGDASKLKYDE